MDTNRDLQSVCGTLEPQPSREFPCLDLIPVVNAIASTICCTCLFKRLLQVPAPQDTYHVLHSVVGSILSRTAKPLSNVPYGLMMVPGQILSS